MSIRCSGITNKGKPCTNRITHPKKYCRYHVINNDMIIDLPNCPICLCDIDTADDDPNLICGHKFHIGCLNGLFKLECPLCRGPLEFKSSSKVDIDNIKLREEQVKINDDELIISLENEFFEIEIDDEIVLIHIDDLRLLYINFLISTFDNR